MVSLSSISQKWRLMMITSRLSSLAGAPRRCPHPSISNSLRYSLSILYESFISLSMTSHPCSDDSPNLSFSSSTFLIISAYAMSHAFRSMKMVKETFSVIIFWNSVKKCYYEP